VKFLKLEEYSARLPRRPPPVAANPFPVHGGRLACTLPAACASSRSTCGAAGGVGRALGRPGQRPARAPMPTAWRSGAAGGPWRARACATGTHGKARAPGEAGHTFAPTNPLVAENKRPRPGPTDRLRLRALRRFPTRAHTRRPRPHPRLRRICRRRVGKRPLRLRCRTLGSRRLLLIG
jgi:hypothetical protein